MKFKSLISVIVIATALVFTVSSSINAQTINLPDLLTAEIETGLDSSGEESTTAGSIASPSAEVVKKIQEKKDQDITETTDKQKSKLVSYLDDNPVGELKWNNFLQHSIRFAVSEGVPANVIVLVLLFPLIASFIAASRHVIGLRGFGIYAPAVLSVALVSTGILEGLVIFTAIVIIALLFKQAIRKLSLPYLPRTALLLWVISLGILAILLLAPILNLTALMSVNIFPMLILVLLAENFLDAQARTKQADAIALTVETIGLAFVSGLILKWEMMQRFALIEPELLIFITASINIIVGKFAGLRVTEYLRFRTLIEEEQE